MENKIKVQELRSYQYEYHYKHYPYLKDWKKNPYSFLKARFYMELSALLVFMLLKTKIKPNTITILYALSGVLGGLLLSIPSNITIGIAIFIFFSKGILDWSDGHLARIKEQTSNTGHVLDIYGAHVNKIFFQMGLGFYLYNKTGYMLFIFLVLLIPLFSSMNLVQFSRGVLLESLLSNQIKPNEYRKVNYTHEKFQTLTTNFYSKIYNAFMKILDDRARSIDFICLLILIEQFTKINLTFIIFFFLIFKNLISLIISVLLVTNLKWNERKVEEIYILFSK